MALTSHERDVKLARTFAVLWGTVPGNAKEVAAEVLIEWMLEDIRHIAALPPQHARASAQLARRFQHHVLSS